MKKKVLSILLTLVMVIGMLPTVALAASSDKLTSMTINGTPYYAEALDTAINPSTASAWTWDGGTGLTLRSYNGSGIVFQAKSGDVDYAVNVYVEGDCTINGNLETNVLMTPEMDDVTRAQLHIHLAHGASLTVTGQIKGYEVLISGPSTDPAEGAKGILDVKGGIDCWYDPHITGYTPVKIAGDVKALIGNGSNAYGIEGRSVTVESPAYALIQGTTYALEDQSWINVNADDYTVTKSATSVEAMPKVSIKDLKEIKVTSQPTKTEYFIGDDFDPTGMVVTAYYDDGTPKVLSSSDYTLKNHEDMPKGTGGNYLHGVRIVYEEDGVTKDAWVMVKIEKSAGALTGISVDPYPTKTKYRVGDDFDPTGMVVTAHYANGTSSPVTDYTLQNHEDMPKGGTNDIHQVLVQYEENGVTQSEWVQVKVKESWPLTGIEITKAPNKTTYTAGEDFDPAGMVVTATYEDGFTKVLTESEYDHDGDDLTAGTTQVQISYYDSASFSEKYAYQAITVGESGGETTVYTVSVSADPEVGGTVTGAGEYEEGTSATVTATAAEGYEFVKWTKGDTEVSTDASYTFTVTEAVELVAVFEAETPAPEKTDAPVIDYNEDTFTVTVTGNGTVKVYVNGVEVTNPYTFEQGEEEVTYTVTATAQDEGKEVSDSVEESFTVPAKEVPVVPTTSVTVKKVWAGTLPADAEHPDSVIVVLKADDENYGEPVTLNADNQWTCTWTNLPVNDASAAYEKAIVYTVDEVEVPAGYTPSIGNLAVPSGIGFEITNTYNVTPEAETVDVAGRKTWVGDEENYEVVRPASIVVNLLANGEAIHEVEVAASTQWTYSFNNLPKYDEAGEEITYTVQEEAVEGYTATYDGFNITNTYNVEPEEETTSVTVVKEWDDGEGENRPETITVILKANGQQILQDVLGERNNWTTTFENLPVNSEADGAKIVYTVDEVDVPTGYTKSIDEAEEIDTGIRIIITNTKDVEPEPITIEIPVSKVVTKGGNTNFSGRETFEFVVEVFNSNIEEYVNVTDNTITVTDKNGGSTTIKVTVPGDLYDDAISEGFRITEKAGSAAGWTYSNESYLVVRADTDWAYYLEGEEVDTLKGSIVFTNTYTKNVSTGGGGGGSAAPSKPVLNKEDHFAFLAGYTDGTFGPERNMTRGEVATMFARLLTDKMDMNATYENSFSDVPADYWAYNFIGYVQKFGLISGYSDGTFRPNAPITRAEFATIACRFEELTEGTKTFSDVPETYWAYRFISYAAERGWVSGYTDGTFRPDNYITRAEVVTVTCRLLERNADKDYINKNIDDLKTFPDVDEDYWAYWFVMEATNGHDYTKKNDKETWSSLHK